MSTLMLCRSHHFRTLFFYKEQLVPACSQSKTVQFRSTEQMCFSFYPINRNLSDNGIYLVIALFSKAGLILQNTIALCRHNFHYVPCSFSLVVSKRSGKLPKGSTDNFLEGLRSSCESSSTY